jgi:hypothetical protein
MWFYCSASGNFWLCDLHVVATGLVCLLVLSALSALAGEGKKKNSVALVRKRTIPTERPPLSAK